MSPEAQAATATVLTRDVALTLAYRDEVYHRTLRNRDGSAFRARVNGACKTWKTKPHAFSLPMKHGLYECFYITEQNCEHWVLTDPTRS